MRAWTVLLAATAACANLTGASDLSVVARDGGADPATGAADSSTSGKPAGPTSTSSGDASVDAPANSPPTPFDFADVSEAEVDEDYKASAIVRGIEGSVLAAVVEGDAALRTSSGQWRTSVTVSPGDTLEIEMTSSETPSTTTTARVSVGNFIVDWRVTTGAACAPQNVDWTSGDSGCSAPSGTSLNPGRTRLLTDSTVPPTGKVTVTCTGGVLVLSGGLCEPPKLLDVSGLTGCVNGQCMAALPTSACVPDPALASEICVFKGYAAHTAFTSKAGLFVVPTCRADGTGCTADPSSCNIVFDTVTCRY